MNKGDLSNKLERMEALGLLRSNRFEKACNRWLEARRRLGRTPEPVAGSEIIKLQQEAMRPNDPEKMRRTASDLISAHGRNEEARKAKAKVNEDFAAATMELFGLAHREIGGRLEELGREMDGLGAEHVEAAQMVPAVLPPKIRELYQMSCRVATLYHDWPLGRMGKKPAPRLVKVWDFIRPELRGPIAEFCRVELPPWVRNPGNVLDLQSGLLREREPAGIA